VPVFFRAAWTQRVDTWSFVKRLDLLPLAVLLRIGAPCPHAGHNPLAAKGMYQQPAVAVRPFYYYVVFTGASVLPPRLSVRQPPARLLAIICLNMAVRADAFIVLPWRTATVRAVVLP